MPITANLRPSELVLNYMEREFLSGDPDNGGRLPTTEQIALHLEVGVSTVRSVVRKLVAEGRLETAYGRGTFVKKNKRKTQTMAPSVLRIGTNMLAFESDRSLSWSQTIYMGAVKMAAMMRRDISLMPVAPPGSVRSDEEIHRELLRQIGQIDMLMLFPSAYRSEVRRAYEDANKPVVDINQPSMDVSSNFVSANFYEASMRVGGALREAGRRDFVFVGDPVPDRGARDVLSSSTWHSFSGFSNACRARRDPGLRLRVVEVASYDIEGREQAREGILPLLTGPGARPDAIFCFSDAMAPGVVEACEWAGLRIPEDVSIVSGTGLPSEGHFKLNFTRLLQPMDQIGANAVRILCHRYDNQNAPVPGLFLRTSIRPGVTTRPEENAILAAEE